jgi:hypothetical protein
MIQKSMDIVNTFFLYVAWVMYWKKHGGVMVSVLASSAVDSGANQSLLFRRNAACLAENQQIPIL